MTGPRLPPVDAAASDDLTSIRRGWDPDPARSMSLAADAYCDPLWFDVERHAVFTRTWQWVCHVEKVRDPGSFTTTTVADRPVLVVRDG
jgi:hypothetical protein